jgi:hypothetical protein
MVRHWKHPTYYEWLEEIRRERRERMNLPPPPPPNNAYERYLAIMAEEIERRERIQAEENERREREREAREIERRERVRQAEANLQQLIGPNRWTLFPGWDWGDINAWLARDRADPQPPGRNVETTRWWRGE